MTQQPNGHTRAHLTPLFHRAQHKRDNNETNNKKGQKRARKSVSQTIVTSEKEHIQLNDGRSCGGKEVSCWQPSAALALHNKRTNTKMSAHNMDAGKHKNRRIDRDRESAHQVMRIKQFVAASIKNGCIQTTVAVAPHSRDLQTRTQRGKTAKRPRPQKHDELLSLPHGCTAHVCCKPTPPLEFVPNTRIATLLAGEGYLHKLIKAAIQKIGRCAKTQRKRKERREHNNTTTEQARETDQKEQHIAKSHFNNKISYPLKVQLEKR